MTDQDTDNAANAIPSNNSLFTYIGVGKAGREAVGLCNNLLYKDLHRPIKVFGYDTNESTGTLAAAPTYISSQMSTAEGFSAKGNPELGRIAAERSIEEMRRVLNKKTVLVFIVAGMGGGTGTGAAPVIAKAAKECGCVTVGIVSKPLPFEPDDRHRKAELGIRELRKHVDTLIVIGDVELQDTLGTYTRHQAFYGLRQLMYFAAKQLTELFIPGLVGIDAADIRCVISNGGVGKVIFKVADSVEEIVEAILASRQLQENKIRGVKKMLLNIWSGNYPGRSQMDTVCEIARRLEEATGSKLQLFPQIFIDDFPVKEIRATAIMVGFELNDIGLENEHCKETIYSEL